MPEDIPYPEYVEIETVGARVDGIAVFVEMQSLRKNHFSDIYFTDHRGIINITKQALVDSANKFANFYIMDYGGYEDFNGIVIINLASRHQLREMSTVYNIYKGAFPYSSGYIDSIYKAMAVGADIPNINIRVTMKWNKKIIIQQGIGSVTIDLTKLPGK